MRHGSQGRRRASYRSAQEGKNTTGKVRSSKVLTLREVPFVPATNNLTIYRSIAYCLLVFPSLRPTNRDPKTAPELQSTFRPPGRPKKR